MSEKRHLHTEGTHQTEPHEGYGGTKFEGVDAKAGLVIGSLAVIGGTLVIVFAITIWFQKILEKQNPVGELASPLAPGRVLAPAPQLQVHPWEELPDMRAQEEQVLNSYGKDADGHFHIPIAKAMDLTASRLNIRTGAPQGLRTPGGEGRDFARSLNDMPTPYRAPQIQGVIRKHAQ